MSMKSDLLQLKGIISGLPEDQQATIKHIKKTIRDIVEADSENGLVALGWVSMELALENE